jgi:histidine kinase
MTRAAGIERDLHDGIQQRLVSLGPELRVAQASVPPELGELERDLARVAEGLTSAFDELREISRGIHPAILSEGGLVPALRALSRRSTLPVELDAGDAFLRAAIRDDGIGGANPRRGSGLVGVSDRIEALGGAVGLTSLAGNGTTLLIEIPLDDADRRGRAVIAANRNSKSSASSALTWRLATMTVRAEHAMIRASPRPVRSGRRERHMTNQHVTHLSPAESRASGPATMRELHSRDNHGIQVELLWCERDSRVLVAVTDTKTGAEFSVPVRDGERALDVFHHPYAYAASYGVDTGATSAPVDSDTVLSA